MRTKRFFFIFFILNVFLLSSAGLKAQQSQTSSDEYFDYETKDEVMVFQFDTSSKQPTNTQRLAHNGLTFYVIGGMKENKDKTIKYYLIRFNPITEESEILRDDPTIINSTNSAINFYCILAEDFEKESIIRKKYAVGRNSAKLNFGILSIPIKIRPKLNGKFNYHPVDYTGDFTIGSSFGVSLRLSPYRADYINFSLAGGVTTVSVDSLSTNGYVKQTTKWSALSPGFAITFDFSGFQIGGVVGCDFAGGAQGANWIYNNNFWYSFGIGYQFIKPKESKTSNQ